MNLKLIFFARNLEKNASNNVKNFPKKVQKTNFAQSHSQQFDPHFFIEALVDMALVDIFAKFFIAENIFSG